MTTNERKRLALVRAIRKMRLAVSAAELDGLERVTLAEDVCNLIVLTGADQIQDAEQCRIARRLGVDSRWFNPGAA